MDAQNGIGNQSGMQSNSNINGSAPVGFGTSFSTGENAAA